MKTLLYLLFTIFLIPANVFAHGEDKPGPRGGIIRMPGAFHTELVQDGSTLKIYLLDFNFEDPLVDNSSVSGEVYQNGKTVPLSCKVEEDFFRCEAPEINFKEPSDVKIKSSRDNKPGIVVTYILHKH